MNTVLANGPLGSLKGLATGMPISSGTNIADGTIISEIHSDTNPPTIVLSKNILNAIGVNDDIVLGSKSLDSQSHNVVLPVDYKRPDLTKGMPLIGAGIKPGTLISDPGVAGNLKVTIAASASIVPGVAATADAANLAVATTLPNGTYLTGINPTGINNRLDVASIKGISKGMIISNFGGPLDKKVVSDMGTTAGGQAWIEVVDINSTTGVITPPNVTAFAAAAMSSISFAGSKTLDKNNNYFYISPTDASSLNAADPISGEGIPLGAYIGTKSIADPITGLIKVTMVDKAGTNPVYPVTDSYASVQLAFKDQVVTISDFPTTDSYKNVTLSLGDSYRPAAAVGDVRISFNEYDGQTVDPTTPPDYTFVGTDGKPLDGITLQAARTNAPKIRTFNVGNSGDINIVLSNGQTFTTGAVLLQTFKDPGALTREGDNLFSGLLTAGPYNGRFEASNISALTPSTGGLGVINGGSLELSNVDLGEEFSTMIITQRAFQAGSRVITTTDQMMEEAVNLKR